MAASSMPDTRGMKFLALLIRTCIVSGDLLWGNHHLLGLGFLQSGEIISSVNHNVIKGRNTVNVRNLIFDNGW